MTGDYSVAKIVKDIIWRITVCYQGQVLSFEDIDLFRHCLLMMDALIIDLFPGSLSSEPSRFWRGFLGSSALDVRKFAETLDYADKYLKRYLEDSDKDSNLWNVPSFKHSVREAGLYWGVIKPVEKTLVHFLDTMSVDSFRVLNTWFNFPLRMNLRSLDFSLQNVNIYIQQEMLMRSWVYPDQEVEELAIVMQEWLRDFNYNLFAPKHGPGAVAELKSSKTILSKYENMRSDQRLEYFYKNSLNSSLGNYAPWIDSAPLSRVSELVLVPKSMLKNRSISKEPISLQFTQQGILFSLVKHFENCPEIRKHIKLNNQEKSRDLSRIGSICGEYATIDLSNASDSVTWTLVKRLFKRTALYSGLVCSRSDCTLLPGGVTLQLEKFAPMGSALCFPIECLIFAGICELASRKCGCTRYFCVYGDDIICHVDIVEEVLRLLSLFNFTTNVNKSFVLPLLNNFRESCGGEFLNGIEVTPFRISRWFASSDKKTGCRIIWSANVLSSWISFANKAYDSGLFCTRRVILSSLSKRFSYFNCLLFDEDDDSRVKTFDDSLTNWKLKKRFCLTKRSGCCYQRTEYRAIVAVSRRVKKASQPLLFDGFHEEIRYNEYWLMKLRADTDEISEFAVDIRPAVTVMSWKWNYAHLRSNQK